MDCHEIRYEQILHYIHLGESAQKPLTKANSIYTHVYTILGFVLITQTQGLTIKALKLQIKVPTSPNVTL